MSFPQTELVKTTHYFPNGEGRDAYIFANNGGIARNTYPFKFNEEGRSNKRNFLGGIPKLDAKPLKYKSNGSGRDSYIGFNHGGLMSSPEKFSFYTSLRMSSPQFNGKMYKSQTSWQQIKNNKQAFTQKKNCMRLSIPKYG